MVSRGSKLTSTSASPGETMGLVTSPIRTADSTTPPRWAMPWISLTTTGIPMERAACPSRFDARRFPCPPTPTNMHLLVSMCASLLVLQWNDGVLGTDLRTHRAADTEVLVDGNPVPHPGTWPGRPAVLMQSRWFLHLLWFTVKGLAFLPLPTARAKSGQISLEMMTEIPSYSRDALMASMVFFTLKGLITWTSCTPTPLTTASMEIWGRFTPRAEASMPGWG